MFILNLRINGGGMKILLMMFCLSLLSFGADINAMETPQTYGNKKVAIEKEKHEKTKVGKKIYYKVDNHCCKYEKKCKNIKNKAEKIMIKKSYKKEL